METLLIKLAISVIPLITLTAIVILRDARTRKHIDVACRGKRARKGIMDAFASGIMFR